MAAVFALCFLNILLFLWNPTSYCYSIVNGRVWQCCAVECVRSFEIFVVGSWTIAVNLDGISLLTQRPLFLTRLPFLSLKDLLCFSRKAPRFLVSPYFSAVFKADGENKHTRSFFFSFLSSYDECSYDSFVRWTVLSFFHDFICECTLRLYGIAHLKAGYHNTRFWYEQLNAKFILWLYELFSLLLFWTFFCFQAVSTRAVASFQSIISPVLAFIVNVVLLAWTLHTPATATTWLDQSPTYSDVPKLLFFSHDQPQFDQTWRLLIEIVHLLNAWSLWRSVLIFLLTCRRSSGIVGVTFSDWTC